MMRQYVLSVILVILCTVSFADTCPSVADIKKSALNGWKAYDSDDGMPLSQTREAQFKKMIERFALAEWSNPKSKHDSIHCYYIDNTGSSLEAYFAKEDLSPKNKPNSFWYQVSGFMHCAAGKDKCEFEKHTLGKQQLARR
ncbi:MAG: hypothetical protein KIT56_06565 [Gammaproteobacteria bacterium]|nr:hypothetical protein [Gammaproteobacteria bacterium]MCW5583528.1 hypothetical protein [Gammaproteobacteria bacterium]